MTVRITESVWLNTSDLCSFQHLVEVSGLSASDLTDLIETGVIEPANQDPQHYMFQTHYIVLARTARRLRDDFELDAQGLALAINLLRRIEHLETELNSLYAKLSQENVKK
jgi:chaperone modulatory protein CbpM